MKEKRERYKERIEGRIQRKDAGGETNKNEREREKER